MHLGATYRGEGKTSFTVWAPHRKTVSVKIVHPHEDIYTMHHEFLGYWRIDDVPAYPGYQYVYRLGNSLERPDPASRFQPQGVHGPSEIIDHSQFNWSDSSWEGIKLRDMIIYELHTGTFSPEGTFEGIIKKLNYLNDLGINAIELMPLAQFPGGRNWGYDGAYLFAVQNSYGGPSGLKKLVDSCHQHGMAVLIDVVYNHLGPEGTYIQDFGPYFTKKYNTPWGDAVNYDEAWSDGVRNFVIQNAISWFKDYHIDALRLEAIHGIYDFGAKHILRELAEETERFSNENGRKRYLIAESDLNDNKVITPTEQNGYGIDAQWSDDFHHAVHALLTGEKKSYYSDFGTLDHVIKAYREGYVYTWNYSENRKRFHGSSASQLSAEKFIICTQNHDQIGNRLMGERLSQLLSFEALKLTSGAMFIAPYIPLLFMGEEFGAQTPFMYFISHSDPDLVRAVREGRAREFSQMHMGKESPDPQDSETFDKSKLQWECIDKPNHVQLLLFYKKMIGLRKDNGIFTEMNKKNSSFETLSEKKILVLRRWSKNQSLLSVMNFSEKSVPVVSSNAEFKGVKIIDSSDKEWGGLGSTMPLDIEPDKEYVMQPYEFTVYMRDNC